MYKTNKFKQHKNNPFDFYWFTLKDMFYEVFPVFEKLDKNF